MYKALKSFKKKRIPLVASLHLEYRPEYAVCDGLVCIAAWQLAGIPETYQGKKAVVWNWMMPREGAARAHGDDGGLPVTTAADDVVVASVGRLSVKKGMDVLVRAFRQAFPAGTEPVRLEIAGEGPEREKLLGLAAGDGRIRLLGFRADVDELYDGWDVYASAARYEPFGLTILEAMRAGCRLVCTRTQGPVEFLVHQPVTWAEVDDLDSLVAALQETVEKARAAKGRRVAYDMRPFEAAAAVSRIGEVYRAVLLPS